MSRRADRQAIMTAAWQIREEALRVAGDFPGIWHAERTDQESPQPVWSANGRLAAEGYGGYGTAIRTARYIAHWHPAMGIRIADLLNDAARPRAGRKVRRRALAIIWMWEGDDRNYERHSHK